MKYDGTSPQLSCSVHKKCLSKIRLFGLHNMGIYYRLAKNEVAKHKFVFRKGKLFIYYHIKQYYKIKLSGVYLKYPEPNIIRPFLFSDFVVVPNLLRSSDFYWKPNCSCLALRRYFSSKILNQFQALLGIFR